ncbi:MAG: aminopeptidase [Nanoarchaeota archaeon]|nr:aminopeptidase [Nanoarchaeota archaeon]
MDEKEFLNWLKEENLLVLAKKYSKNFINVLKQCLDVKNEKVLLIGDLGYPTRRVAPLITAAHYFAAKELNLNVDLVLQEPKRGSEKADINIIKSLFNLPSKSTIIINASGKLGSMNHVGKSFRKFCKAHNNKFISTTSIGSMDTFMINSIIKALSVDYHGLQKEDSILKTKISLAKTMTIQTRAGTDLKIDLTGIKMHSADGDYTDFGKGGNLPAGEVYFAPNNINGKLVIDGSTRNMEGTVLIQKPITLIIQDGKIVSIQGDEEAKLLEKSLKAAEKRAKYPERVWIIGEVGIGTNLKAQLVGSTIIDEKAYGTAHLGIGSNYWFGGNNRTIIHYDQVFKSPRIKLDGKPLRFNF